MDNSSSHHRVQLYQYRNTGLSTDRTQLYINNPLMGTASSRCKVKNNRASNNATKQGTTPQLVEKDTTHKLGKQDNRVNANEAKQ